MPNLSPESQEFRGYETLHILNHSVDKPGIICNNLTFGLGAMWLVSKFDATLEVLEAATKPPPGSPVHEEVAAATVGLQATWAKHVKGTDNGLTGRWCLTKGAFNGWFADVIVGVDIVMRVEGFMDRGARIDVVDTGIWVKDLLELDKISCRYKILDYKTWKVLIMYKYAENTRWLICENRARTSFDAVRKWSTACLPLSSAIAENLQL